MPWFQVDDQLAFHAKAIAAGNAAMGLWVRAGSWSMSPANLTDGFIPTGVARTMGKPTEIKALVRERLWHEVEGGYQFHEWEDRQRSAEKIRDLSAKRSKAGQVGGEESGRTRRTTKREATDEASASPNAKPPVPVHVLVHDLDQNPSQLTVVCRLTSGVTGATTTTMRRDVERWQQIAGDGIDLEYQALRFLNLNGEKGTKLDNPMAAWVKFLEGAVDHQPKRPKPAGCGSCVDGWAGEDDDGRPMRCPTCRPLRSVEAS